MAEAGGDRMPKVGLSEVSQTHLDYMKKVEKKNQDRVTKLVKLRKRNLVTGLLLATGVCGIYFYSMFAVKQEKFLDDFDEPVAKSD